MSSNTENEIDYNSAGKSENPLSDPAIIDENTTDFCGINDLRNQNPFRVIIGHIKINLIRNKFEPLVSFINNNLDILVISEFKIDETFPGSQFQKRVSQYLTELILQLKGEGFYYISERIYLLNV